MIMICIILSSKKFNLYIYFCRERILGENNPDLLQSIVFRGACYADALQFTSCLKLWFRSIEISQHNNYSISEDILRFAQVNMIISFKKCYEGNAI